MRALTTQLVAPQLKSLKSLQLSQLRGDRTFSNRTNTMKRGYLEMRAGGTHVTVQQSFKEEIHIVVAVIVVLACHRPRRLCSHRSEAWWNT